MIANALSFLFFNGDWDLIGDIIEMLSVAVGAEEGQCKFDISAVLYDSLLVVDCRPSPSRRRRRQGAERRSGMQLMRSNTGNVRRDHFVPVEERNYVFDFWRRYDCTSWAYYTRVCG